MRIQLRLNEAGQGGMSVMFCSGRKVSDILETVELMESMLQMIRTVEKNDQKAVNQ